MTTTKHLDHPNFVKALELLGMPERCTEFKLSAKVGEPAEIEATYYAVPHTPGPDGEFLTETRKWTVILDREP